MTKASLSTLLVLGPLLAISARATCNEPAPVPTMPTQRQALELAGGVSAERLMADMRWLANDGH